MKYEDISKNEYPLGFLVKKVQDSSKNFNRTFTSHTRQMDILQTETIGYEGDLNSSSLLTINLSTTNLKSSIRFLSISFMP